MIGWLVIAVAVLAIAAVLRWSLKGGGVAGYSAGDRSEVESAQEQIRRDRLPEKRRRRDDRARSRYWS